MIDESINIHRSNTRDIFDSISRRYDLSNLILSMGLEKRWRHEFLKSIRPEHKKILDACCGTGTSTYQLWKAGSREVSGMDFSGKMIEVAREKYSRIKGICFYTGDVTATEFADGSFDCVTTAFGIRNILERKKALTEFCRIIRPGGSIVILEFNHIDSGLFGSLSGMYIRRIMPLMGGILTGRRQAYDYLAKSIRQFPRPGEFMDLMKASGWKELDHRPLSGGICSLFTGQR
jgi:demethylmenaquinone methyltransferase / 2-methoxy-6-polyprenyl-1,4-benzoquinol methylase